MRSLAGNVGFFILVDYLPLVRFDPQVSNFLSETKLQARPLRRIPTVPMIVDCPVEVMVFQPTERVLLAQSDSLNNRTVLAKL